MKALLIVGALLIAGAADGGEYKCQIDHSALYATGQTRIDAVTGTQLWEYKCPMGHTYWIAPTTSPNADSITATPAKPIQQPDYSYLHNAGKQAMENAGQQLGQIAGNALRKPQAVAMILTVKCDKYVEGTLVFDNNTTKVVPLNPSPASNANLAAVRAAFPNVRVEAIDAGC
jgi:hypothetical protein